MIGLLKHFHGEAFSVKLNEQSQTCLSYAMKRRKSAKPINTNLFFRDNLRIGLADLRINAKEQTLF